MNSAVAMLVLVVAQILLLLTSTVGTNTTNDVFQRNSLRVQMIS